MMYHAIKAVYDRKAKTQTIEHVKGNHMIVGLAHRGYYVTDNLATALGLITAGRCEWWNRLTPEKQEAVRKFLTDTLQGL